MVIFFGVGWSGATEPQTVAPHAGIAEITDILPKPVMLPLLAGDSIDEEPHTCSAELFSEAGERLASLKGKGLLARLSVLRYNGADRSLTPLTDFYAPERKQSFGKFTFKYVSNVKTKSDVTFGDLSYTIDVRVSNRQECSASPDWICNAYRGTLDFSYEYQPGGGVHFQGQTPQLPISLREECRKDRYNYDGVFVFPGFLDYLGAIMMGGSR